MYGNPIITLAPTHAVSSSITNGDIAPGTGQDRGNTYKGLP